MIRLSLLLALLLKQSNENQNNKNAYIGLFCLLNSQLFKMIYASDFSIWEFNNKNKGIGHSNDIFSVLINENNKDDIDTEDIEPKSFIAAAKPFLYYTSFCGHQMAQCWGNKIKTNNIFSKSYCFLIIVLVTTLIAYVKPVSWVDTKADIPLNVLTRSYGLLHDVEVFYSILSISFFSSQNHVNLLKNYSDIDKHLRNYCMPFWMMRLSSILFFIFPTCQVMFTLVLRKFYIANIGVYITLLMLMLQGSIIYFLIFNFYQRQKRFNKILESKIFRPNNGFVDDRRTKFGDGKIRKIFNIWKNSVGDSNKIQYRFNYCWFELMQMYDKTADCMHLFNKIYSRQVFIMFSSWLVCTILTICRSLSPSLKYSELFLSDMYIYSCINGRPFFLAVMCELIIKQWKKTHGMLLQALVQEKVDKRYMKQVRKMLDLVENRKPEISANIFPVNIPTVMHFSGRAISYAVLMIQYFYIHILHDFTSKK